MFQSKIEHTKYVSKCYIRTDNIDDNIVINYCLYFDMIHRYISQSWIVMGNVIVIRTFNIFD